MAERRAMQKYYPPDWTPDQGSINKYVGQHPLRDRAKKLDQGILVIRFEMPYNIWCLGCNTHIGKGVRFNAEKKQAGSYFSTKIWSFTMPCPHCAHKIEVRTDPKARDYVLEKGARRVEETPQETAEERGVIELQTDEEVNKIRSDAFYKLEHQQKDEIKGKDAIKYLAELKEVTDRNHRLDYDLGSIARKKFREEKKSIEAKEKEEQKIRDSGIYIPLLENSSEDASLAQLTTFKSEMASQKQRMKRMQIQAAPIFPQSQKSALAKTPQLLLLAAKVKAEKKRKLAQQSVAPKKSAFSVQVISNPPNKSSASNPK